MIAPGRRASYLAGRGGVAHKRSGNGLVSSEREAGLDRWADRAGGRGQRGLEDRVDQGRASHRGIRARDSPENRAGGGGTVQHGGGC